MERRYSLIEMYTTLWVCATLVERLSNLALRVHYDDRYGRMTEAVLGYASHALRAKGGPESLLHLPGPSRANNNGIRAVKCNEAINRRCDFARDVLEDDR